MTPLMTLTQATCAGSEYFEGRGSDGILVLYKQLTSWKLF